jgi:hypothetical protein
MSKNYYPEMLELINSNWPVDKPRLYRWMCKHRPKSVIDAINAINDEDNPVNETPHYKKCRELYNQGKRIDAIKHWKESTGCSLMRAKDMVTSLFE